MTSSAFPEFYESFFSLAEKSSHIAITSHISPDDDSIGSVLLMRAVLMERFPEKKISIIYTGQPVERYRVFDGFAAIEWVDDVANHLEGVDLLVMLDASQYPRFSKFPEKLATVPITIAIDHHSSVPESFSLLLYRPEYSSNAELVYRTLVLQESVEPAVASYALLGILGDTGNFSYVKPSQTDVFTLAKQLIENVGMPIDQFRSQYGGIPIKIIPLLQALVKNTAYVTVDGWPPMQYAFIDRETVQSGNYSDEDMSAASHIYMGQYLPRIIGYSWGVVLTPRMDGTCRMSSRSLPGSVNVRVLHEQMGIGSGHDRAAGAAFTDLSEPVDCIARVMEFMKANRPMC